MALSEAARAGSAQEEAGDSAYGENARRYYEKVREEDLLLTHTLIPPQVNRSLPPSEQLGGEISAQIVSQDDSGIVVRGARLLATIGPFADELLVFPSTLLRGRPEDAPYSLRLCHQLRRPRPALPVPRVGRLRDAATSTTPWARASRRSTPSSSSTT